MAHLVQITVIVEGGDKLCCVGRVRWGDVQADVSDRSGLVAHEVTDGDKHGDEPAGPDDKWHLEADRQRHLHVEVYLTVGPTTF